MPKTLTDLADEPKTDVLFEERCCKFEAALKPLVEKWGVAPVAVLQTNSQSLTANMALTDLWQKDSGNE